MAIRNESSVQDIAVLKTESIADQMAEYFLMLRFADEMVREGILDDHERDELMDSVLSSDSSCPTR